LKKIQAQVMGMPEMAKLDIQLFMEWVWRIRSINMFDPEVIGYPRTVMCRADNGEEPLLSVPLQAVLMYDAIAPKEGITGKQEAISLLRIQDEVDNLMRATGHREVYFLTSDDRVADYVQRHGDRGFTEIKGVRVLRRKVRPEEKPIPEPIVEAEE
jgi:hypothetical protein